ncbi:baseplate assembly protein [Pectobacterium carotovorum]|uniref:baseplate assembly protein n=1 Tax=Pectobacterium carotovorum TaxID=554 RepID=UPI00381893B9
MATVDLSQLPQPQIIEVLDFEVILRDVKAVVIAAFSVNQQASVAAALELESEPLNQIAQVIAYRELMLRQRINEGAASCMLSHAVSNDLDNLAANLNTERLVITAETESADAVMESDAAFRLRAQSAFEGLSVAGPTAAYEYFAKSASGKVKDAKAISPSPAVVVVSVISSEGNGTASSELLLTVETALSAEDKRPVADRLTVQSAEIVDFSINAVLYLYPGPESEPIHTAAQKALQSWIGEQGMIGRDVALSSIMAALHVQGVQRVSVVEPSHDIVISDTQAAYCTGFTVTTGGIDE